jgi:hypothetical protein
MLQKILKVMYKNSNIIRNKNIQFNYLFNNYINQVGGDKPKTLLVTYNDLIYKFEKSFIDDNHYILYSTDELECVSILIDSDNKIAEIHGIGNYKTCVITTLSNTHIGSTMLKIALKMLKKYKNILEINKIMLTDNSIKYCDNIRIELPMMLILLSGETWYGKYGFRPFNNNINKIYNEDYNKNIEIMNKITIYEADILKYIMLTNKKSLIKDVKKLLTENPNYLLKDFIKSFLTDYDKTCKYFNLFYNDLFKDIGLTNFRGLTFILNL